MLIDTFGRPLRRLRISVTTKCRYKCLFCHREGSLSPSSEPRLDDLVFIAKAFLEHEVRRVKLTGGEPLEREDISDIVEHLKDMGFEHISMTTNGFRLPQHVETLAKRGLDTLAVSIPSLKASRYKAITGFDYLSEVLKGLDLAVDLGLEVKVNYVVLKGLNDDEYKDFINLARDRGVVLRIIELQPLGMAMLNYERLHDDLTTIINYINSQGKILRYRRDMNLRPLYEVDGAVVEVVSPTHNPYFCKACTTMRLTPDLKLKPCLMRNDNVVDIAEIVGKRDYKELTKAIELANLRRVPFWR